MANALTKKAGPLPVWGWGVVGLGGLLLGVYLRKRLSHGVGPAAPTGSPPSVPTAAVDTSGTGASAPQGGGLDPNLAALLANSQQSLVELASASTYAGIEAQRNSFSFASYVYGSSLDFARHALDLGGGSNTGGGGGGGGGGYVGGGGQAPALPASHPAPFGEPSLTLNSPAVQEALRSHRAPPGGF